MSINEYQQKVQAALDAAGDLLTRAEAENRDLTDDETTKYDTLLSRAERLKKVGDGMTVVNRGGSNIEPGSSPQVMIRKDPFENVDLLRYDPDAPPGTGDDPGPRRRAPRPPSRAPSSGV